MPYHPVERESSAPASTQALQSAMAHPFLPRRHGRKRDPQTPKSRSSPSSDRHNPTPPHGSSHHVGGGSTSSGVGSNRSGSWMAAPSASHGSPSFAHSTAAASPAPSPFSSVNATVGGATGAHESPGQRALGRYVDAGVPRWRKEADEVQRSISEPPAREGAPATVVVREAGRGNLEKDRRSQDPAVRRPHTGGGSGSGSKVAGMGAGMGAGVGAGVGAGSDRRLAGTDNGPADFLNPGRGAEKDALRLHRRDATLSPAPSPRPPSSPSPRSPRSARGSPAPGSGGGGKASRGSGLRRDVFAHVTGSSSSSPSRSHSPGSPSFYRQRGAAGSGIKTEVRVDAASERAAAERHLKFKGRVPHGDTLDRQLDLRVGDISFNRDAPGHGIMNPLQFTDYKGRISDQERDFMRNLFRHLTPSGRAETVLLGDWMDETVDDIRRRFDRDEDVDAFQQALASTIKIVFSELVRQVSVHCVERGIILTRTFNLSLALLAMDRPLEIDPTRHRSALERIRRMKQDIARIEEIASSYRAKAVSLVEEMKDMRRRFLRWEDDAKNRISALERENVWLRSTLQRFADMNQAFLPPPRPGSAVPGAPAGQVPDTHRGWDDGRAHVPADTGGDDGDGGHWYTSAREHRAFEALADTYLAFFQETSDVNIYYATRMRKKMREAGVQTPRLGLVEILDSAVLKEQGKIDWEKDLADAADAADGAPAASSQRRPAGGRALELNQMRDLSLRGRKKGRPRKRGGAPPPTLHSEGAGYVEIDPRDISNNVTGVPTDPRRRGRRSRERGGSRRSRGRGTRADDDPAEEEDPGPRGRSSRGRSSRGRRESSTPRGSRSPRRTAGRGRGGNGGERAFPRSSGSRRRRSYSRGSSAAQSRGTGTAPEGVDRTSERADEIENELRAIDDELDRHITESIRRREAEVARVGGEPLAGPGDLRAAVDERGRPTASPTPARARDGTLVWADGSDASDERKRGRRGSPASRGSSQGSRGSHRSRDGGDDRRGANEPFPLPDDRPPPRADDISLPSSVSSVSIASKSGRGSEGRDSHDVDDIDDLVGIEDPLVIAALEDLGLGDDDLDDDDEF